MESIKGLISIEKAFSCQKCKKLAYEPFVSDCCEAIICNNCLRQGINCPFCERICKLKGSALLTSIYKSVACECPYKCRASLSLYQLKSHLANCPEMTAQCPYCKKPTKIKQLPEHLGQDHIQQCNRMLIQFHRQKDEVKSQKQLEAPKIKPFKVGITGNYNIDPRICCAGRMVCGRPLPDSRHSSSISISSSSLFHKATSDLCSLEYGSCDKCMELDVDRLGLPTSYLLNLEGRICVYIRQKRKVACGCSNGSRTCNDEVQCTPCKRLSTLIERGFYKKVIGQNIGLPIQAL